MGGTRTRAALSVGRLLVGLTTVVLVGGCAAGASPTPVPATPTPASLPSEAATTPAPTATATAAPTPTATAAPSVVETDDLAYETTNPLLEPGKLDVYAPARAGPWPVVVMLHGQPTSKRYLTTYAQRVADLGFVVFVPAWGHATGGREAPVTYDSLQAVNSQTACAVAFARSHAAEYGGDLATMIVFGHSAGALVAAMVAFARPKPTAGCLGGTTLGAIDALVTWEGDWILGASQWDSDLPADPRLLGVATPLKSLAKNKDLKVVMLVSENPGLPQRPVGDPKPAGSFLAVRDPSGVLRKQLGANGALADGQISMTESQQLLFSVLEAQGNPVSLDVMPGSTHESLSDEGWEVFLDAFKMAAAPD